MNSWLVCCILLCIALPFPAGSVGAIRHRRRALWKQAPGARTAS